MRIPSPHTDARNLPSGLKAETAPMPGRKDRRRSVSASKVKNPIALEQFSSSESGLKVTFKISVGVGTRCKTRRVATSQTRMPPSAPRR
jgi:hypothetical protein